MSYLLPEPAIKPLVTTSAEDKTIDDIYVSRINILRFIAICSIVWGHCFIVEPGTLYKSFAHFYIDAVFLQIGKIGTINFFLISGFLLADKIDRLDLTGYLRYRWFSIILPWLIFMVIFALLQILQTTSLVPINKFHAGDVFAILKNSWIYTAYWFIPVTILSGCILVIFKRRLNQVWFACLIASVSLFYAVNLYYDWVSVHHTKAFLGFLFFFWLGLQTRNHFQWLKLFLDGLSWRMLLPLFLLFFVLSCAEGIKLTSIGCEDAYASTRLSNIGLSIVVFLSVLKFKKVKWIDYFKPQKYVYGIYLIHTIAVFELKPLILNFVMRNHLDKDVLGMFFIQLFFFVAIFMMSYLIAVLIKNSNMRFMIGKR